MTLAVPSTTQRPQREYEPWERWERTADFVPSTAQRLEL